MHIVLLNDDSVPTARGGSALVAHWQRQEFVAHGHEVTLITTHQDRSRGAQIETPDDIGQIISIYVDYPLQKRHRMCLKNPAIASALDALLAKLKPDVVHAHTIHTYLTYDALRVAAIHTNKVFMTAHDTFLVSFDRVNSERYRSDTRKHQPHKLTLWDHLSAVGRRYWPLRNNAIRSALKDSKTTIISITKTLDDFLKANGIENTTVIHNGVKSYELSDAETRSFRHAHQLTGPTLLYGGRINADKGVGVLLQAMKTILEKIPSAQLLILGEKDRLDPHLLNIPQNVQDAVVSTGWIEDAQMPLAYAAADIVTTPSIYLDAFNLMNIEGMASSKPIVGTCFGGTAEIVIDNETGFVRDPTDTKSFADACITLLKDEDLRSEFGKAGKKRQEEAFSLDRHIEKHLKLYQS